MTSGVEFPSQTSPKRWEWLLLMPVVVLALGVRLHTIDRQSLWADEIRQVTYYNSTGLKQVMYNAATQSQPPLDYWIGYLVFRIDQSDLAARLPATVFGTLVVVVCYWLARSLLTIPFASLVALGIACSPYQIHYSQEARPYTIMWFFLLLALLVLQRAWRNNRWWDWGAFLVVTVLLLLTRTITPVVMTGGIALWGTVQLWKTYLRTVEPWRRFLFTSPAPRLLCCLVLAWALVSEITLYVIHVNRAATRLIEDSYGEMTFQVVTGALLRVGQSLIECSMPFSWILLPAGFAGVLTYVCTRRKQASAVEQVALMVVATGFVVHLLVHVCIYTPLVSFVPKHVYWAYTLPFLFVAAAWMVQALVQRYVPPGRWFKAKCAVTSVVAVALLMQLRLDSAAAIQPKADWRGATAVIAQAGLEPDRDVVFCNEASSEWGRGMVFRMPQHYLPSTDHLVNLFRNRDSLYVDRGPILGRRDCRVAFLVRCGPEIDTGLLRQRLSVQSVERFEYYDFLQFFVLVSKSRYSEASDSLAELEHAVIEMLGTDNPMVIDFAAAQTWIALQKGHAELAKVRLQRTRELLDDNDADHVASRETLERALPNLVAEYRRITALRPILVGEQDRVNPQARSSQQD